MAAGWPQRTVTMIAPSEKYAGDADTLEAAAIAATAAAPPARPACCAGLARLRQARDRWLLGGPRASSAPVDAHGVPRRVSLFARHCRIVMCMSEPVAGLLVCIVGYVWLCGLTAHGSDPFVRNLPYFADFDGPNTTVADGDLALGTLYNSLFLLSTVIFTTLLFLVLFRYKCRRVCFAILVGAFLAVACGAPAYLVWSACGRFRVALDWITVGLFVWNFGAVGVVVVYWEGLAAALEDYAEGWWPDGDPRGRLSQSPRARHQWLVHVYLVLQQAGLAWPFLCMEEFTVWAFLVLIVAWDLVAVLTPCGPLRYIMHIERTRRLRGEAAFKLPPGLIYETPLFQLGTGDLLFYGVVVGRAATINFCVMACTALAIFAGMAATIYVTVRSNKHALPALPLALGLAFFSLFTSRYLLEPWVAATVGAAVWV